MTSINNTKNTDYKKKKLTNNLNKKQIPKIKTKLNNIHKLLTKQINFTKNIKTKTTNNKNDKKNVNYVSNTNLQKI